MRTPRAISILPSSLVALILISTSQAASPSFGFYPENSQDCLDQAADTANCPSSTVEVLNSCLCSNGGDFVTNTAKCLGTKDPDDVDAVFDTMQSACANSQTPLNMSKARFESIAASAASTTTSKTRTTLSTSTKSSTSKTTSSTQASTTTTTSSNGLSTGAKAGIIAGSLIVGLALLGAIVHFFMRYRRRHEGEESHPMLTSRAGHVSFVPTLSDAGVGAGAGSHYNNNYSNMSGPVAGTLGGAKYNYMQISNAAAGNRVSMFNWESPDVLAYPGSPATDGGIVTPPPLASLTRYSTPLFELAGTSPPARLSSSKAAAPAPQQAT
ncbi:hypothetical protein B0T26DRAFT_810903 [Lasiosphaeria miniovina]|uniref:Extracellular membrane protein CFEM domain-containing protein n=1 Tax=Lasiosphaeria miniovina TaxID=1954250 RepID=A0AA40AU71_9PEZI|nr:uncharacterized protein B0T26DRAFT_810903 [Lasiosphaeria miniovina]KAK0721994.1 hypothetical protein B0T26DRAFT_810903 [Lasiosphaeria miniovina]